MHLMAWIVMVALMGGMVRAAEGAKTMDTPMVSFVYDGKKSSELLGEWKRTEERRELGNGRVQRVTKWVDETTGLEVRVVGVEYSDFAAVEWTGYFKNGGKEHSALLEQVRGIDAVVGEGHAAVLRTIRGDDNSAKSYMPLEFRLEEGERKFSPLGGRPSNAAWPYFNLDFGNNEGMLIAVGWPGQWSAEFKQEGAGVRVSAGQEMLHVLLRPGEEVRTPLVATVRYKGDWIEGQNEWRRWFVAHNMPRPGGKLPGTFTAMCMGLHQSAKGEKEYLDTFLANGIKADYWWMDAGWYEGTDWWKARGVGTWAPDKERFPKGIREVADHVHANGMKLVLWFEPERVREGSFLWEKHPEWLLEWDVNWTMKLLNLGNAEARKWLTDYVSEFITREGVDLYRQDFNVDPLKAWRRGEAAERQGMTENMYVQGYLAYWDALLERHPGMLIDSCASGGRRNDLETLRRSVPLLRSDFQAPQKTPVPADMDDGNQGHTYGLAIWVPYYGSGVSCEDVYSRRSHLCPAMGVGTNWGKPDWAGLKKQLADYRRVAPMFYGDFYPLMAYSEKRDAWMAWEFVRPKERDGMVQVFRREESEVAELRLKMRRLNRDATYEFTDVDTEGKERFSGAVLMDDGLPLRIAEKRNAVIRMFREIE